MKKTLRINFDIITSGIWDEKSDVLKVWMVLVWNAGSKNSVSISMEALSKLSMLDHQNVVDSLARLADIGFITNDSNGSYGILVKDNVLPSRASYMRSYRQRQNAEE